MREGREQRHLHLAESLSLTFTDRPRSHVFHEGVETLGSPKVASRKEKP